MGGFIENPRPDHFDTRQDLSRYIYPDTNIDDLLSTLLGLRAYSPVEEEPKDGFRVVIEFVPPLAINIVRRRLWVRVVI